MKVEVKVVVRNIIINKQSPVLGDTVSNQRKQMPVMNSAYGFNLGFELSVALSSTYL